ncbi:MAG: peptidylprolyl isomerase [Bacteroidaceae bacterium]|nr:peptidylprolyl isomerase [Bacteroidaceae bacterium]
MKRNPYLIPVVALLLCLPLALASCGNDKKSKAEKAPETVVDADTIPVDADQYVRIETTEGDITLRLFRDTPRHRHNFVKLAKKGYYNNQTFYRIISGSLIQAGDPASKTATRETKLGSGDVDYTLEPELIPEKYYHRRGAIAMASYKPMLESSGGQFYIVTGYKHQDVRLNNDEIRINKKRREVVFDSITKQPVYQKQLKEMKQKDNKRGIWNVKEEIKEKTDSVMATRKPFAYSKEQRQVYKTIGGEASLDGFYTVFGEVIEGDEVLTKIEKRAVNAEKRPLEDVRIKQIVVLDK